VSNDKLYIGIDGGGTKTTTVVVDATGQELTRHTGPTSNPAVIGFDATNRVLLEGLRAVRQALGTIGPFAGGWVGLAGVDRPGDRERLESTLATELAHARITNDGDLMLAGLGDGAGIGIIAGTGSIVMGRGRGGERVRAGGWGHIIGDEGSGWDFGVAALKAIAAAVDGSDDMPPFATELLAAWELEDPRQIITRTYAPETSKRDIARFASFTIQAAEAGFAPSLQAVQTGARMLATQVNAVASRLALGGPLNLALAGGLLLNVPYYRDLVLAEISALHPISTVTPVDDPALASAQEIASMLQNHHHPPKDPA
jgi:N-acetylglucosamine kinase-like BadF-type ATPase